MRARRDSSPFVAPRRACRLAREPPRCLTAGEPQSPMKPILYVKHGCPWCVKALDFFNQHGVNLDVRDVSRSTDAMRRMVDVSGQTKCPTFEYEDFVVADFSVDEFLDALDHEPEIRRVLGIAEDED